MTRGPESLVKAWCRIHLAAAGAWFFFPAMGQFGRRGVSDIVGIHRGRGFAIECKAGKGKTTELQERELQKVRAAGGYAFIVNETDGRKELQEFLNG